MIEMESIPGPVACPVCACRLRPEMVNTAIWYGERVVLVENIPARVCDRCAEKYYDDETTEGLLRLTEDGFPWAEQTREILVPVYTLKRRPPPSDLKDEDKVWPGDLA